METNECPICQTKELAQVQHDLNECKKRGRDKDRQIKKLNKQVFILTMVAIGIGAIFGKEALDSITEWLSSIKGKCPIPKKFQCLIYIAENVVPHT